MPCGKPPVCQPRASSVRARCWILRAIATCSGKWQVSRPRQCMPTSSVSTAILNCQLYPRQILVASRLRARRKKSRGSTNVSKKSLNKPVMRPITSSMLKARRAMASAWRWRALLARLSRTKTLRCQSLRISMATMATTTSTSGPQQLSIVGALLACWS